MKEPRTWNGKRISGMNFHRLISEAWGLYDHLLTCHTSYDPERIGHAVLRARRRAKRRERHAELYLARYIGWAPPRL